MILILTIHSMSPSLSKRGKNRGAGRAHAYAVRPKDPTHAYINQYHNVNNERGKALNRGRQQPNILESNDSAWDQRNRGRLKMADHVDIHLQHLSDSDGESTNCWGSFQKALCGCCIKQGTEQTNMEWERQREEERCRELRRIQKEERQREQQRKMEEERQKERKKLQKAARQQEIKRRREEEREKELQTLKERVLQWWAETVGQQTWRLTEEEVEEMQTLQKREANGQFEIEEQQDQETELMSETDKARILYRHFILAIQNGNGEMASRVCQLYIFLTAKTTY